MKRALAVGCLLMAVGTVAGDRATSLKDAQAAIDASLKTPEGKAFDERMGSEFSAHHLDPLRKCKAAGNPLENFWILFRLDANGGVEEVLLYPETKLGVCARDSYAKDRFVPPPHADYWVGVYLQLAK
jgi:hypothetical protein